MQNFKNDRVSSSRIRSLDGVRAVAILMVFAHHALNFALRLNVHGFWMGVDIFFVLSGFLITGVLLDNKARSLSHFFRRFYERRARRLLVPYALALGTTSFFFGVAWIRHWYFYFFLTNFLTVLQIPHPLAFNPLWSLAVEEQFYIVWPFVVYFLSEKSLARVCAVLIVAAPILRGTMHFQTHWPIYALTPFRMDLLAAGALIALVWRRRNNWIHRYGTVSGAILVCSGIFGMAWLGKANISTFTNTPMANVLLYESTLLIGVGVILFALAGRGVGILENRVMAYIGKISYTMYLVHMIFLEIPAIQNLGGWPYILAALSCTIGYAAISWRWIETPLLRAKTS